MNNGLLITGVAIAALVAGSASATMHKSHHKAHMGAASMYAPPSQPIPYAQLDSYLSAKPSQRASMGDSGAPIGSSPAPQASETGMSPPSSPTPEQAPAGDQMGSSNSGAMNGMSGSSGAPPATGDTGAATPPPPATPEATPGAPDGSSPPPK